VVSANLLSCQAPAAEAAGRFLNVATNHRITLNQTFETLKKLTGYRGTAKYGPDRSGDVKHSLADISLAEKHLGYEPLVNFEEGLKRTVNWYRTSQVAMASVG
jgi:UDP-glucose 4-epimerase